MQDLIIRAVKLTGIQSDLEQIPEVKHVPIISLHQLSDERWNELAKMNRKVRELYG